MVSHKITVSLPTQSRYKIEDGNEETINDSDDDRYECWDDERPNSSKASSGRWWYLHTFCTHTLRFDCKILKINNIMDFYTLSTRMSIKQLNNGVRVF